MPTAVKPRQRIMTWEGRQLPQRLMKLLMKDFNESSHSDSYLLSLLLIMHEKLRFNLKSVDKMSRTCNGTDRIHSFIH